MIRSRHHLGHSFHALRTLASSSWPHSRTRLIRAEAIHAHKIGVSVRLRSILIGRLTPRNRHQCPSLASASSGASWVFPSRFRLATSEKLHLHNGAFSIHLRNSLAGG